MLSPKRLVEKAKREITLMRYNSRSSSCTGESTTMVAEKGHFVVYSMDGTRFMVPLVFLKSQIFQELLKISEEEFGLLSDGPITLVYDAAYIEYVLSFLNRSISEDVERALLASIYVTRCSLSSPVGLAGRINEEQWFDTNKCFV